MRHLPILTNSAEKAWRACAMLYRLAYVDLIRPINDGEALVFGTLIHAALEAWWRAAQSMPARECPICTGGDETGFMCQDCQGTGQVGPQEWLRAAVAAIASERDPFRRATAEALILGYHNCWSKMRWDGAPYDGAPIEALAVEVEFNGPLLNPDTSGTSATFQRGGKIDVLIRVRTDLMPGFVDPAPTMASLPVWVVEHKSSSEDFSAGSPYRARLRLDTQVSGYHVGARLLGHHDVAGVLYDVIGKPGQKPLRATPKDKQKWTKTTPSRLYAGQRTTDESAEEYQDRILESIAGNPADYFARFEVVRLKHEEEAAARDTWMRMQEIRDAARLNRYPRNPSSCGMYGRACAYLPICVGDATANDGTRYRKAETAHEELSSGQPDQQAA